MKASSLPSGEKAGMVRSTVVEGSSTSSSISVALAKLGSSLRAILAK